MEANNQIFKRGDIVNYVDGQDDESKAICKLENDVPYTVDAILPESFNGERKMGIKLKEKPGFAFIPSMFKLATKSEPVKEASSKGNIKKINKDNRKLGVKASPPPAAKIRK